MLLPFRKLNPRKAFNQFLFPNITKKKTKIVHLCRHYTSSLTKYGRPIKTNRLQLDIEAIHGILMCDSEPEYVNTLYAIKVLNFNIAN